MNPSRISYSNPTDSNLIYPKDVILKQCEFCGRTFIPDSLTKHKKVCYKDYLKKRSKITKQSTNLVLKKDKLNAVDISGMNITELMIKRQIRRMQWRGRHEEFIKTIREARQYAIAANNGLKIPVNSSVELKEEMHQCKYCLRKFHKDSMEKHLKRCREYSIQSTRSRLSEAQIEAKRRLSLRLYYKPQSYHGDSPDNLNTSISSNDLDDFQSLTSNYSQTPLHNNFPDYVSLGNSVKMKSESKVKRQSSISNHRLLTPVIKNKRHQSAQRKSKQPPLEVVSCSNGNMKLQSEIPESDNHLKENVKKDNENTKCRQRKKCHVNYKSNDKSNSNNLVSMKSSKTLKLHRNKSKHEFISSRLNEESMVSNKIVKQKTVTPDFIKYKSSIVKPDPAESLRKAKEIINFLEERTQQSNHLRPCKSSLIENECESITDQLKTNGHESDVESLPSFQEESIRIQHLNRFNGNVSNYFLENITNNCNDLIGSASTTKGDCEENDNKCVTSSPIEIEHSTTIQASLMTEEVNRKYI